WLKTNYTINWQRASFAKNGIYRFKIVVFNLNMEPIEPVYFYFQIDGDPLPETSTTTTETSNSGIETSLSTSATSSTNPFQYSTPGYTLIIATVTLLMLSSIFKRKLK
ncbi:MAG: hypothetical protein ACTSP4_16450, partial [Candidatus Hodarchaeales archaeon]